MLIEYLIDSVELRRNEKRLRETFCKFLWQGIYFWQATRVAKEFPSWQRWLSFLWLSAKGLGVWDRMTNWIIICFWFDWNNVSALCHSIRSRGKTACRNFLPFKMSRPCLHWVSWPMCINIYFLRLVGAVCCTIFFLTLKALTVISSNFSL